MHIGQTVRYFPGDGRPEVEATITHQDRDAETIDILYPHPNRPADEPELMASASGVKRGTSVYHFLEEGDASAPVTPVQGDASDKDAEIERLTVSLEAANLQLQDLENANATIEQGRRVVEDADGRVKEAEAALATEREAHEKTKAELAALTGGSVAVQSSPPTVTFSEAPAPEAKTPLSGPIPDDKPVVVTDGKKQSPGPRTPPLAK